MPSDLPQGPPTSPILWNSAPSCDPMGSQKMYRKDQETHFQGRFACWVAPPCGGRGHSWHWNTDWRSAGSHQGSLAGDPWRGRPGILRPICAGDTGGWWPVPGTLRWVREWECSCLRGRGVSNPFTDSLQELATTLHSVLEGPAGWTAHTGGSLG